MKRSIQAIDDHDENLHSKHVKLFHNNPYENIFSDDVLGIISSFLPFDKGILNCLLVSKQWQAKFENDYRFMFIKSVENHLLNNLKGNDDSEWEDCKFLISIKYWLGAREHLLKLLMNHDEHDELKRLWIRKDDEFPNIRFLAFDQVACEEFAVLMINLNAKTRLKMTILYSSCEDYIIYVDIVEDGQSEFDWKVLHIDPTVERNIVLEVNATEFEESNVIEKHFLNESFFENLLFLLGILSPFGFEASPFGVFLWRYGYEERHINTLDESIQDVKFERTCEIYEDKLVPLSNQVNLNQIDELTVLEYAWKKANRIYTKKREENCKKLEEPKSDISVYNVNGRVIIVDLYRTLRFVTEFYFTLSYKGREFIVKSNFDHEFKYDNSNPCRSSIFNCTSVSKPELKYQLHVFPNDTHLTWIDSCLTVMGQGSPIDLTIPPTPFENDQRDISLIFEKVLRILPRYCLFNSEKDLTIKEFLEFFVGNGNE